MDLLKFLPPVLFSVAIWATLEVLAPDKAKRKDIGLTPFLAAIVWLMAMLSVVVT